MEINIVKIKSVLDSLINWVRQDLIANELTPTQSWLYMEFNDVILDDTNFYTQLKHVIEQGDDDQRRLEVRLMFDKERANLPTIHIHYPSEDGKSGDNSLNTGFLGIEVIDGGNTNLHSRSFIGQYELIITGGNSLEVIMLYEFLDGLMIAGADTLSYNFDKFEFSGKQLMANQDIIPYLTYYRAIGLSLQNKKIVRSLVSRQRASDIGFVPRLYADNQQPDYQTVSLIVTASALTGETGETINFLSTPTNGGDSPIFEWYLNDVLIPDEATNILSLTFSQAGTFTVQAKVFSTYDYLGPTPASSNILTIVIS